MALKQARNLLNIEAQAITDFSNSLDENFQKLVDLVYTASGKVIVTGMGKSGIIGRKIASTLTSTGTPATFLHPAEAIHGDLGIILPGDVILALSHSGETQEILQLIRYLKETSSYWECKIVVVTDNPESSLARLADISIDLGVKDEGCPLGLAPMASTTVALAFGDALASVLITKRDFKATDFGIFHPGGSLGKKVKGEA